MSYTCFTRLMAISVCFSFVPLYGSRWASEQIWASRSVKLEACFSLTRALGVLQEHSYIHWACLATWLLFPVWVCPPGRYPSPDTCKKCRRTDPLFQKSESWNKTEALIWCLWLLRNSGQTLKIIWFLIFLKKLEALTPNGGVSYKT